MRSIALGGRAPLLATNPVPWPLQADTNFDLAGLSLVTPFELFDQVTSALDPELVGEVLKVIRVLALETNMTMLIVTHEMHFARDVSDRVLFVEGGSIMEDAPPEKIFTNPEHERTRAFLHAILDR